MRSGFFFALPDSRAHWISSDEQRLTRAAICAYTASEAGLRKRLLRCISEPEVDEAKWPHEYREEVVEVADRAVFSYPQSTLLLEGNRIVRPQRAVLEKGTPAILAWLRQRGEVTREPAPGSGDIPQRR